MDQMSCRKDWLIEVNKASYDEDYRASHVHAIHRGQTDPDYSEYGRDDACWCVDEPCYGIVGHIAHDIAADGTGSPGLKELVIAIPADICNHVYAAYVMNLFKGAFLTKTLDEGLKNGFDMNIEEPYQYLLAAMISMRKASQPWEMEIWEAFRKAGASEDEAFYMTDSFNLSEGFIYNWANYRPDHSVFSPETTLKDFLSIAEDIPRNGPSASKTAAIEHGEVWGMWPHSASWTPVGAAALRTLGDAARFGGSRLLATRENYRNLLKFIRKEHGVCAAS